MAVKAARMNEGLAHTQEHKSHCHAPVIATIKQSAWRGEVARSVVRNNCVTFGQYKASAGDRQLHWFGKVPMVVPSFLARCGPLVSTLEILTYR